MCFSAEISFTSSAILAVIGAITLKNTRPNRLKPIALVPVLFAVQQFFEGIVWLHMNGTLQNPASNIAAQYGFLSFAWVLWPFYAPFAVYWAENEPWKKTLCLICLAAGLFISLVDVRFLIAEPLTTSISGNRINYGLTLPPENIFYGLCVMVPIFISSIKYMWVFGALLLFTFIFSQIIYSIEFTSVWCFFAAINSIVLYFILQHASRFYKSKESSIIH